MTFGEKTADLFKKDDHSLAPAEEDKQTVAEAILKKQKEAMEEDFLSYKDIGKDNWIFIEWICKFISLFSENREKFGDALNKQLTTSFHQFEKVSDDTDSQKEPDESTLADLRKAGLM